MVKYRVIITQMFVRLNKTADESFNFYANCVSKAADLLKVRSQNMFMGRLEV
jgi:hypothetical protein